VEGLDIITSGTIDGASGNLKSSNLLGEVGTVGPVVLYLSFGVIKIAVTACCTVAERFYFVGQESNNSSVRRLVEFYDLNPTLGHIE
jgi:hypothetical protein